MKKKRKFSNLAMILLLITAVVYVFMEDRPIKISAMELENVFKNNPSSANQKYFNKNIELTGVISSVYTFQDSVNIIKFKTENKINVYGILSYKVKLKTSVNFEMNNEIKISGKCLGRKEYFNLSGVFIEIESSQ